MESNRDTKESPLDQVIPVVTDLQKVVVSSLNFDLTVRW